MSRIRNAADQRYCWATLCDAAEALDASVWFGEALEQAAASNAATQTVCKLSFTQGMVLSMCLAVNGRFGWKAAIPGASRKVGDFVGDPPPLERSD